MKPPAKSMCMCAISCMLFSCSTRERRVGASSSSAPPQPNTRMQAECSVQPRVPSRLADTYSIDACAVCGSRLGARGATLEITHEGRSLRVCDQACLDRFHSNPQACIAHADGLLIKDQMPHYPLKTSIVSGKPLGSTALNFILANRLFRVCDEDERAVVWSDPERYYRALNEAVLIAQRPTYAMHDKCPVQGDILPSDAIIDIVIANRMIRVCCQRCVQVVRARPSQYLGMIDYANRAAREHAAQEAHSR